MSVKSYSFHCHNNISIAIKVSSHTVHYTQWEGWLIGAHDDYNRYRYLSDSTIKYDFNYFIILGSARMY